MTSALVLILKFISEFPINRFVRHFSDVSIVLTTSLTVIIIIIIIIYELIVRSLTLE